MGPGHSDLTFFFECFDQVGGRMTACHAYFQ